VHDHDAGAFRIDGAGVGVGGHLLAGRPDLDGHRAEVMPVLVRDARTWPEALQERSGAFLGLG
jgi:hypothetical protein